MLEIKLFRENKQYIIDGLLKKNFKNIQLVDEVIKLDEEIRKVKLESETFTATLNQNSNQIPKFLNSDPEKVKNLKSHNLILKEKIGELNESLAQKEEEITNLLVLFPNLPHTSVLEDNGDETTNGNIVIKQCDVTETKNLVPHWELIKKYNLINFDLGSKITGAGFPVYIGKGAKLQRALIQYFIDYNTNAGYTEFNVPHLVNYDSAYGTGQLPDKDGQMYYSDKDNLYLIPTAEVPLTNLYRDTIVENLPLKLTGYTPCFRRESGSYGKDVRGLNRLHQFDKVEIVQIVNPEESYTILEEMVKHVEGLLISLNLPYRILKLSSTDMSFASALTYDFEVWSAGQQRWLEVSSVSNFETFQSNRMKIRYKDGKKNKLTHTLNGSSLALPRIMAALLENNYTGDKIIMPEVLQKYFNECIE